MSRHLRSLACIAALTASVLGPVSASTGHVGVRLERELPFTSGWVTVAGDSGNITIRSWSKSAVRIEADRRASSKDLLPRVDVATGPSGLHIRAVESTSPSLGDSYVNYTITVPSTASVEVQGASGAISVSGSIAAVVVRSGSGPVSLVRSAGLVDVSTASGDIRAVVSSLSNGQRLKIHSGSGEIALSLPAHFEADLSVVTQAPSFPLSLGLTSHRKGKFVTVNQRLGNGGGSIDLYSETGSVSLRQIK